MLKRTIEIMQYLAGKTSEVLLFHSATGKDSIALLDIAHRHFSKVVCVFMYGIKNLEYVNRYIDWAKKKYNVEFLQLPHFQNTNFIKYGYLGVKKDEKVKQYNLNDVVKIAQKKTGIDWVILGMKQNDGLNRRVMLRQYHLNAICEKTKKAYPLSEWSNKDVLKYIELNDLIQPISYNSDRSSGFEPSSIDYLLFLKNKYPNDLKKVLQVFPMAQQILFEYDYHKNNPDEN